MKLTTGPQTERASQISGGLRTATTKYRHNWKNVMKNATIQREKSDIIVKNPRNETVAELFSKIFLFESRNENCVSKKQNYKDSISV